MYIRDLDSEVGNLESTEDVDSAQAAAATLRKDWLDIKSVQKGLSNLFSPGRAQKKALQNFRAREALRKYYEQGEPRESDHQADLTQVCQT